MSFVGSLCVSHMEILIAELCAAPGAPRPFWRLPTALCRSDCRLTIVEQAAFRTVLVGWCLRNFEIREIVDCSLSVGLGRNGGCRLPGLIVACFVEV